MGGCSCNCATCRREHHLSGRPLDGYQGETRLTSQKRFVKIANHSRANAGSSDYHSQRVFAIDEDGGLWAWGRGPIGDGTMLNRECPTFIDHGPWIAVTDGFGIKSDGTLWCIAGDHGISGYKGSRGTVGGSLQGYPAGGVEVMIGDGRNNGGSPTRGLYCTPPTIVIDAPAPSPPLTGTKRRATAIAVLQCHALAVNVTAGGSGYTSPPGVTVPQAPSIELEAEVVGGAVVAVRILDKGTFKLRGPGAAVPAVQFSGGGGSGASATLVPFGYLHDVEMTDCGDGYYNWAAQGARAVRDPSDQIRNYYQYPPEALVQLVRRPAPARHSAYYENEHPTLWTSWDNVATIGTLTTEPTTVVRLLDPDSNFTTPVPESSTVVAAAKGQVWASPGGAVRTGITDAPIVEVYTPGKGQGATLRVETLTNTVNSVTFFEHRIHIENRGSGYEFTPHIKATFTKHQDVYRSDLTPPTIQTNSKSKTIYFRPQWSIDGHPTPMPTPTFALGGEAPGGVVATASQVVEYGRMTPKRKRLEVTNIGITSTAQFITPPFIYNTTGVALSPVPMSAVHSDLGGKWLDVQGNSYSTDAAYYPAWGRAINERGEVWVWGAATASIATPSVAPMPLGGELTGGTSADAGTFPPPARGVFAYYSASFSSGSPYGYLSSPGEPATYHPPRPVARFDNNVGRNYSPVFTAMQANGNLVFWRNEGGWHRGHYTDEQYEWCTSTPSVFNHFARRKNGGAYTFTFPPMGFDQQVVRRPVAVALDSRSQLHTATSAYGMRARLPDGSVIEFDGYALTRRYIAGTEATVTAAGSGYRQAAILDEPTFPGTPTATWPATLTGGVYGVDVEDPGQGYQSAPQVTFTGGDGSGAAAEAVIEGPVVRVDVTAGGSGYTKPPIVRFSRPGVFAEATASIDLEGRVTGVAVHHGGVYRSAPQVFFDSVDGNGSGAAATAVIDGSIQFVRVTSVGTYSGGTTSTPKVSVQIPGAKAHAIMLYDWSDAQGSAFNEHWSNESAIVAATASWTLLSGSSAANNIFHAGQNIIPRGTLSYPFPGDSGRYLFHTKPVVWRRGDEFLAAVTELAGTRQTYSHPMAMRYPFDYSTYAAYGYPFGSRSLVPPTSFFGSYWPGRVYHDGPATFELTNVVGQGATATAIRDASGGITGWSWNTANATHYLVSHSGRSMTFLEPYAGRVVLPAEGRPATAVAEVVSHTEDSDTYYTVSAITITDAGKFLTPPKVYLEADGKRVDCVPTMVRGIQSIQVPRVPDVTAPDPRFGGTVIVGGGEITPATVAASSVSGGAYTGKPRVYRGGRPCRVDMTRYATLHAIANPHASLRWSSPPTVVIETSERPGVERWYGFCTTAAWEGTIEHIRRYVPKFNFTGFGGVVFDNYRASLESFTTAGPVEPYTETDTLTWYTAPFVLRGASRGRIVGARIYNELSYYYSGYIGSMPRYTETASLVPTNPAGRVDTPTYYPNRLPARQYNTHPWSKTPGHITVTRPVWGNLLDDIILQRE